MNSVQIIKASGERESWDPKKLERSLRAAHAEPELIREITGHIEKDLRDGIRTSDIYEHAFTLLKKYSRPLAAQYSLRVAIMQLGPSGYPFEKFVATILEAEGYKTTVGTIVQGLCVPHEVDVVATKENERILVEAKFHNSPSIKSDVKVALYVHARFEDIAKRLKQSDSEEQFTRPWLITNTNFTSQAIQYGNCVGMAMTGWNYPHGHTLQDLVQATQTHPVTCLTTLTPQHKNALLAEGVVLCTDIIKDTSHLQKLGLNRARIAAVEAEGSQLCPVL